MKVRNGFVSNSSSSSFVLIGYKLDKDFDLVQYVKDTYPEEYAEAEAQLKEKYPDDPEKVARWLKSDIYDILYEHKRDDDGCCKYLSDDGPGYIGKIISQGEDYLNDASLNGAELMETIRKVQEEVGRENPPSLYVGTVAC